MSDEDLDALQERHLAFLARMREEGNTLASGPVTGQPDESLRGISIYRTSVDDARRLAGQDPSVVAGRLALEMFTWLMPTGSLGDRPSSTIEDP
jgi:uncharacterized protein